MESFQPKRPMRVWSGASRMSTVMAVPRMAVGWPSRIPVRVLSAMHSTKPSPSVFKEERKVRTFSPVSFE